jgi:hypothetical protein
MGQGDPGSKHQSRVTPTFHNRLGTLLWAAGYLAKRPARRPLVLGAILVSRPIQTSSEWSRIPDEAATADREMHKVGG